MTRGEITVKLCAVLMCAAWVSACNLTDPNPPLDGDDVGTQGDGGLDAGGGEDIGGGDTGGEDAGGCAEADKNACGGCTPLDEMLGASCSDCGELVCDGLNGLRCTCDTNDNCGFSSSGQSICECAPGFAPEDGACVDVDECAAGTDDCDELTDCMNTPGGFTCSECPAGTTDVSGDGKNCQLPFENVEIIRLEGSHPGNTSECLELSCPAGKVALSGGYEGDVRMEASRRSGADGSRWLVCGFAENSTTWAVSAVCATPNAELVQLDSTSQIIAAGSTNCATRECPSGYKPVGGGGTWPNSFTVHANQPAPDVNGWRVCGLASRSGDAMVTVGVVCANTELRVVDFQAGADDTGPGCLGVVCENGETLLGGGGDVISPGTLTKSAPLKATPAKPNDAWEVCRTLPVGVPGTPNWKLSAICLPKPQ